jgi:hypothetical protein
MSTYVMVIRQHQACLRILGHQHQILIVVDCKMNWKKLTDFSNHSFFRGTVFIFSANHPYEKFVDYMLVSTGVGKELMCVVTSGNKAGSQNILCHFPEEAYTSGSLSISSDWLQKNWSEFVYDECNVKDVYVSDGYPPPSSLP